MFKAVSPNPDVKDVELDQLAFWKDGDIFKRTMSERADGSRYVFYEGPPTANGRPGSHHVLSRAFKDLFPRYKTMTGHYVLRKGGWDTHGLPVEIEVQKQLGIEHKHEIEEYGIAEFNEKCRASVFSYLKEWEELTERIAFWVDLEEAYITFKREYIESVWWLLRQLWDKDLLYQGFKVVPYSAKAGATLSNHEVNLGYRDNVPDPSFWVRFALEDEPDTYFLVWTTTPWTLTANVALVVGEDIDYVKVEGTNQDGKLERLYFAEALLKHKEGEGEDRVTVVKQLADYKVIEKVKGSALTGRRYTPLFTFMPTDKDHAYVLTGEFVNTDEGSGIVHMAPAFGADDLAVGQANDLPMWITVNDEGKFIEEAELVAGLWFKDADPVISEHLAERGLVFHHGTYYHTYPFSWRTDEPLLYYARSTWFIRTSVLRDRLVGLNKTINWTPEHVRDGRFGNWLEGNVDWALGRERYWGTPLPIWVCDHPACDHRHCIGSVAELSELSGQDLSELDLHRPYVDEVTWECQECDAKGTMRRVPELIDVWFDSGAMPYAQWGYPYANEETFKDQFPADYICEAVDQTRGWFYTLHAIGTLVFDSVAYKNVICLGLILDGEGKKMSKSKGNVVNPWDVIDRFGADIFRWYMYTASPPGEPRRFSLELVEQSFRSFWLTLWHTYRLFVDYANVDGINPSDLDVPVEKRNAMDRWLLSQLNALVRDVTEAFEAYDATGATRPIERFVDNYLSNWYVRRSKPRLWKTENDDDKAAAYLTLYEVLVTISKLLAPSMPFLSDALYRNLVGSLDPDAPNSVHLAEWPTYEAALIDETLMDEMALVMRLASLGLSARNSANIKVRQPLSSMAFSVPKAMAHVLSDPEFADILADELNVKDVSAMDGADSVVVYALNPLPKVMGPKYGQDFPQLQRILREGPETQDWAKDLLQGNHIVVTYGEKVAELTSEDVEVWSTPAEGYAVAEDSGYLAALNVTITPELQAEGLAREFVRRVQSLRKDADFKVDDRIVTTYNASPNLASAVEQFADYIKNETLTDDLKAAKKPKGDQVSEFSFDNETLTLGVKRK
ncbi:MAG: isoleucine--tRNA ligase [Chloroflexi bacterium]|nr:isoleucine--tRNA ligase [Chloroflexota bacterium]